LENGWNVVCWETSLSLCPSAHTLWMWRRPVVRKPVRRCEKQPPELGLRICHGLDRAPQAPLGRFMPRAYARGMNRDLKDSRICHEGRCGFGSLCTMHWALLPCVSARNRTTIRGFSMKALGSAGTLQEFRLASRTTLKPLFPAHALTRQELFDFCVLP
jgi:hypothetical protein